MSEQTEPTSALPLVLRRSFQLSPFSLVLLGAGAWLLLAVLIGFENTASLAGPQAGYAYLLFGLLFLPSVLSHIELRQEIRRSGGSYRLLQALERPALTFLAGWIYLIGWAALSGAVAWGFAGQLGRLLDLFSILRPDRFSLTLGFVTFFTLLSATGRKPAWNLGIRFAGLVALGLLVTTVILARRPVVAASGELALFPAIAALGATAWVLEIIAERQQTGRLLQTTLPGWALGPLLASAIAFLAIAHVGMPINLEIIGEQAIPQYGAAIVLGASALAILLLWYPLSLIMLRQLQTIGADGILPAWMLRSTKRRGYPARLSIFQGLLTVAALGGALSLETQPISPLISLAAATFLSLHLAVGVGSILLTNQDRGPAGKIRLPLFPVIPASAAAINFLLLLALPAWSRAAVLIWLAIGGLAFWQAGRKRMQEVQLGITVFQDLQRRSEVRSDYPVLVPIANPDTASRLVAMGARIARERHGHLVLLQVIQVQEHLPLDSGRFEAQRRLDLLERLLRQAEGVSVQAEGITRLSRGVAQGIMDTVAEESVKMVVMGSPIRPQLGSQGFGAIVDGVLEAAPCEVGIVVGGEPGRLERVLVPVADATDGVQAARLALALTEESGGEVTLAHVVLTGQPTAQAEALLAEVLAGTNGRGRIHSSVLEAGSTLDGILRAGKGSDLVVLSGTDQGLLDEEQFGRLAIQLAMRIEVPLLLIRSSSALPALVARRAWRSLSDLLPTLQREEQLEIYRRMREAVRPNINYFVLTTLSAVIATLGLLLNSPAVVIGAMLVAPLMTPIVGTAVGITFGDARTLRDGLSATLQGMLAAIFIAILVTAIVPVAHLTNEVLSRSQPTLIDLIVALASGMAGAYAIARKEVGEALPGVAIAAALLPPLASVGIGIALGEVPIAGGALLLFTTNLVAIIFASSLVFLLLGVRPPQVKEREQRLRQGLVTSVVTLALVSLPLAYFLRQAVERDRIARNAGDIVRQAVQSWGDVQLADLTVQQSRLRIEINGTLYVETPISQADISDLEAELNGALPRPVSLNLFAVSGVRLGSSSP